MKNYLLPVLTPLRPFFRKGTHSYALVLLLLTSSALAENAAQPDNESVPEYTNDQSAENTAQNVPSGNKPADSTVPPEEEQNPDGTEQTTIFRPTEDISEDIVIAFPVDI